MAHVFLKACSIPGMLGGGNAETTRRGFHPQSPCVPDSGYPEKAGEAGFQRDLETPGNLLVGNMEIKNGWNRTSPSSQRELCKARAEGKVTATAEPDARVEEPSHFLCI